MLSCPCVVILHSLPHVNRHAFGDPHGHHHTVVEPNRCRCVMCPCVRGRQVQTGAQSAFPPPGLSATGCCRSAQAADRDSKIVLLQRRTQNSRAKSSNKAVRQFCSKVFVRSGPRTQPTCVLVRSAKGCIQRCLFVSAQDTKN